MPKTALYNMEGKAIGEVELSEEIFAAPINEAAMHLMVRSYLAAQRQGTQSALTRYTKRGGQVWIKIFPDKPVTAKPAETRMGSGKGAPEYWVAVVKPGRVLFEIAGVSEEIAREALCDSEEGLQAHQVLRRHGALR